jgi:hemoglobin
MKPDLVNKTDISLLVDSFYERVKLDSVLGPIFNETMQVNWALHLPKMYLFWENNVFHTGEYNGHPFAPHLKVNAKVPLGDQHFSNWISLFNYG